MNLKDGSNVVADLITVGRKTGLPRPVELRFLYYQGSFYATSSRVEGKHWCQNMLQNPTVELRAKGKILSCTATRLSDDNRRPQILTLRDPAPQLDRVVFEIKPNR
jgi:deazaflavin-dependent oxidoreductase (nitroreductase family)